MFRNSETNYNKYNENLLIKIIVYDFRRRYLVKVGDSDFAEFESWKPNSPASENWTILEKIFAPLQAALSAVARSAEVYAVNLC